MPSEVRDFGGVKKSRGSLSLFSDRCILELACMGFLAVLIGTFPVVIRCRQPPSSTLTSAAPIC